MNGCLDIREVTDKQRAVELIREREESLVFVLGWNNSFYRFDAAELELQKDPLERVNADDLAQAEEPTAALLPGLRA